MTQPNERPMSKSDTSFEDQARKILCHHPMLKIVMRAKDHTGKPKEVHSPWQPWQLDASDATIEALKKAHQIKLDKKVAEARKQAASDIFSLAHEYAQQDKTMRGSEELRHYHYFNAIHEVGEFDGR